MAGGYIYVCVDFYLPFHMTIYISPKHTRNNRERNKISHSVVTLATMHISPGIKLIHEKKDENEDCQQ